MQEDCIESTRAKDTSGYPMIWFGGRLMGHHRLVFFEHNGYLPPVVMHRCDNPACINPAHLLPGDRASNVADMKAKGRAKGRPRLTAEQAAALRSTNCRSDREDLAREFGISRLAAYRAAMGKTYSR